MMPADAHENHSHLRQRASIDFIEVFHVRQCASHLTLVTHEVTHEGFCADENHSHVRQLIKGLRTVRIFTELRL